jgi:ankyrin repeat protein
MVEAARVLCCRRVEVRRLLRAGADVNAKNGVDWTPLHFANVEGCHLQVVNKLMEHGSGTGSTAISGYTPLNFACNKGHLVVVIALPGLRSDIDANNDSNSTTTTIISKRKSRGVSSEAKDNNGDTHLHWAIFEGHLVVLKALLSSGTNILAINYRGHLPILDAVNWRNSAVSKFLFQQF